MVSEKENIRRYYAHETPDHYADLKTGLYTQIPSVMIRPIKGSHDDWYGVHYAYDEVIKTWSVPCDPRVITDITQWEKQVVFPDLDAIDWEALAKEEAADEETRANKMYSVLLQCGVYERFHALQGIENAMINMLTEPEASMDLLDAIGDYRCRLIEKFIDYYKPDIIRNHDDYGSQRAIQMDPDLWREMIKPQLKKIADLCHSKGVFYEQHSCGIIEPIVEDLVEVGVDSWQGMSINNVPMLLEKTNGRLLYHMSLRTPDYLVADLAGNLDEKWLREDARKTLEACAPSGCYFNTTPSCAGAPKGWWVLDVLNEEVQRVREKIGTFQ